LSWSAGTPSSAAAIFDQHATRFGRGHPHLLAAELDAGRPEAPPWFTLVAVSPMWTSRP